MSDTPVVPRTPPHLLPGRSASSWDTAIDLVAFAGALGVVAILGLAVALGGSLQSAGVAVLACCGIGSTLAHVPVKVEFDRRAYRERDAGCTTLPGEAVMRRMWWLSSVPMFSTTELWRLDGRTGAVLRRPGGATLGAWKEEDEFLGAAKMLVPES